MKTLTTMLVLLCSIGQANHASAQAQTSLFDVPDNKYKRAFFIDLGSYNEMKLEVTAMADLDYIRNLDSLLKLFLKDLSRVGDTSATDTWSRRYEYDLNQRRVRTLRIRKTQPAGDAYAFPLDGPARLKMDQDTVLITGRIPAAYPNQRIAGHYFRISFFVNGIEDMSGYKDRLLNEKLALLQQHYRERWAYREDGRMALRNYPDVTSASSYGYRFRPEFIRAHISVNIQNYKDHFVPSLTAGVRVIRQTDYMRRLYGLDLENHFAFEKDAAGKKRSRVNLLLAVSYEVMPLTSNPPYFRLYPAIHIAYTIKRKGDLFDPHSVRLGIGKFMMFGNKSYLQPNIYFNHFFKGVTPGLRFTQLI